MQTQTLQEFKEYSEECGFSEYLLSSENNTLTDFGITYSLKFTRLSLIPNQDLVCLNDNFGNSIIFHKIVGVIINDDTSPLGTVFAFKHINNEDNAQKIRVTTIIAR